MTHPATKGEESNDYYIHKTLDLWFQYAHHKLGAGVIRSTRLNSMSQYIGIGQEVIHAPQETHRSHHILQVVLGRFSLVVSPHVLLRSKVKVLELAWNDAYVKSCYFTIFHGVLWLFCVHDVTFVYEK